MKSKIYLILAIILNLMGCSTSTPPELIKYDPSKMARVRMYGKNGYGFVFYRDKSCVPSSDQGGTRVSGEWGQAFGSLFSLSQNETIGMPVSQRSSVRQDGVMAKEYFKEYVVAANAPISLKMQLIDSPNTAVVRFKPECNLFRGVFTPKSGQDYDVYPQGCGGVVSRIVDGGEGVRESSLMNAPQCD